jgi:hypothetical protein
MYNTEYVYVGTSSDIQLTEEILDKFVDKICELTGLIKIDITGTVSSSELKAYNLTFSENSSSGIYIAVRTSGSWSTPDSAFTYSLFNGTALINNTTINTIKKTDTTYNFVIKYIKEKNNIILDFSPANVSDPIGTNMILAVYDASVEGTEGRMMSMKIKTYSLYTLSSNSSSRWTSYNIMM